MMQTPDVSHLDASTWDSVYEPAEDSFLLLDALEKDLDLLRSLSPAIVIEVGSGSGVVATALARELGAASFFIATDINPKACRATRATSFANKADSNFQCVCTDLVSGLTPRLTGNVDLLLCNPPYVSTVDSEVRGNGLEASWAGGRRGRVVVDRLLEEIPKLMSPEGLAYLLLSEENGVSEIQCMLKERGMRGERVLERKAGYEVFFYPYGNIPKKTTEAVPLEMSLAVGHPLRMMVVEGIRHMMIDAAQRGDWRKVLNVLHSTPHDVLLCWARPTEETLVKLGNTIRQLGLRGVVSVGAGTGLLEWLLHKATGLPVEGLETDRKWWQSSYAPPVFIPHHYADESAFPLPNNYALLFCYFNNAQAFQAYLDDYSGSCVMLLGPSNNNGKYNYCDPEPLGLQNQSSWKLSEVTPVGSSDILAIYVR